jgi:hypothetical protein
MGPPASVRHDLCGALTCGSATSGSRPGTTPRRHSVQRHHHRRVGATPHRGARLAHVQVRDSDFFLLFRSELVWHGGFCAVPTSR